MTIPAGEITRLGFNKKRKASRKLAEKRDLNKELTLAKPGQLFRCPRCRRMSIQFNPSAQGGAGALECIWQGLGCEKIKEGEEGVWKRRIPQEQWRGRYRERIDKEKEMERLKKEVKKG
jgi:hypothetical protein